MALRTQLTHLADRPVFSVAILMVACVLIYGFLSFRAPEIYVYPDSVSYQGLAKDLAFEGQFDWQKPSRPRVPPLYPLYLSVGYAAGTRMAVHAIQVGMSQVALFATLIPIYLISRRILNHRQSLLAVSLFCLLPIAAYSRWLMSEALFIPLFMLNLWLVLRLDRCKPKWADSLPLAVGFAAAILTRLQGLLILPILGCLLSIDLWTDWRTGNRKQALLRLLWHGIAPAILTGLLSWVVWKSMGYIQDNTGGMFYWRPVPKDGSGGRNYLEFFKFTGYNFLVIATGLGIFPFLFLLFGLSFPAKEPLRMDRLTILAIATMSIHLAMSGYLTWSFFLKAHQIKAYGRYMAPAIPLLFPLIIRGIDRAHLLLTSKGSPKWLLWGASPVLALILAMNYGFIMDSLWLFSSNLQHAPLAWLIRQTGLSPFWMGIGICALGFALLFGLAFRKQAGYAILLLWILILQIEVQDLQNWSIDYRDRLHQIRQVQAFCMDYFDQGLDVPIVVEPSSGTVDFRSMAVTFWTQTEPITDSGRPLPGAYYRIGKPMAGDRPYFSVESSLVFFHQSSEHSPDSH